MTPAPDDFARGWLRDWNSHDLDAILGHYAEDVVFRSPKILGYTGGKTDKIIGRDNLRPYFARGLAFRPDLKFTPTLTTWDRSGVALIYSAEDGATAVETMTLDAEGRVAEARVFYDRPL
jgi:ketosteroid isomerase-like protein